MDKPTVYIETSIVSYLAARPSRDPVTAHNQRLTHEWWNTHRHRYELYTSELALLEAGRGDPAMARRRLALLTQVPSLQASLAADALGRMLQSGIPLPEQARNDAEHIALAAAGGMSYLLTWDRKHIANPRLNAKIQAILGIWGYLPPVICTPDDLMKVDR